MREGAGAGVAGTSSFLGSQVLACGDTWVQRNVDGIISNQCVLVLRRYGRILDESVRKEGHLQHGVDVWGSTFCPWICKAPC